MLEVPTFIVVSQGIAGVARVITKVPLVIVLLIGDSDAVVDGCDPMVIPGLLHQERKSKISVVGEQVHCFKADPKTAAIYFSVAESVLVFCPVSVKVQGAVQSLRENYLVAQGVDVDIGFSI